MRENRTSGTARGVPGNRHSYRRGATGAGKNQKSLPRVECTIPLPAMQGMREGRCQWAAHYSCAGLLAWMMRKGYGAVARL
jgi:hypothetical protein